MKSNPVVEVSSTEYYSLVSGEYDTLYLDGWSQLENKLVQSKLQNFADNILDLGCGTGQGRSLLNSSVNYTGIDSSPKMLEIARAKYPNSEFILSNMANLEMIPDNSQDVVLSIFSSFSYCLTPDNVVKEIVRVLKPGGRLLIMPLNQYAPWRILSGHTSKIDFYQTRRSKLPVRTRVRFYSIPDLVELFGHDFDVSITSISILGNLFESKYLWKIDRILCQLFPTLGHNLIVEGCLKLEGGRDGQCS